MKLGTLSYLLIILIVISGFVVGYTSFYAALLESYSFTGTNTSSLRKTQEIFNKTEEMYETINASQSQNIEAGSFLLTAPINLLTGAYRAGILVLNIPNYFQAFIHDMGNMVGVPTWVTDMGMGIILVLIIAGIIMFVLGREF